MGEAGERPPLPRQEEDPQAWAHDHALHKHGIGFWGIGHIACCLLLAGCGLIVIAACTPRDAMHPLTIGDYQFKAIAKAFSAFSVASESPK